MIYYRLGKEKPFSQAFNIELLPKLDSEIDIDSVPKHDTGKYSWIFL